MSESGLAIPLWKAELIDEQRSQTKIGFSVLKLRTVNGFYGLDLIGQKQVRPDSTRLPYRVKIKTPILCQSTGKRLLSEELPVLVSRVEVYNAIRFSWFLDLPTPTQKQLSTILKTIKPQKHWRIRKAKNATS